MEPATGQAGAAEPTVPVSAARYARVAPPLPVDGLFTYAIPPHLVDRVRPGVRVQVPFGARKLTAMCVGVDTEPPPGVKLKALTGLVEDEPLAGEDLLKLSVWIARHTGCSVGEALDAMLPRAIKTGSRTRTIEQVHLLDDPRLVAGRVEELQAKREKQARALRILADRGGVLSTRELMSMAHVSRSPIQSLVKAGDVELKRVNVSHDPLAKPVERTEPLHLTDEQRGVYERIHSVLENHRHATFLLHGVTGSGKTEIYLQTLARVVEEGRQGIVLVPEISLTPQTVRRFRQRFDRVAVLHSHLTDAERNDQWRAIRAGRADVVVGARSAVFAPVPKLGLIVLDEEHETSFKQQNVPRYHAREVAIERCRLSDAVTILGTATPSLEAYARAQEGVYERLVLHDRVAGGMPPEVMVVDLTVEEKRKGFAFLSDPLRAAMDDALSRDGQIMLFLNRRGWAQVMLCRSCRTAMKCPHCDVSLTVHRRIGRVLCHYCGFEQPPPSTCPTPGCGKPLSPLGFGTEKVEQEVRQTFLRASVSRMDSDTMSGRGRHEEVLSSFASGQSDVLIGTQMIAKGLDFPNVLLVGVICADSALFLPDYRAAERTFQLLAQVIGRTGRGPKGGRVVVQAYNPRHFAILAGMKQDYAAFAATELAQRKEADYPPYLRLVRVVVHAPTIKAAEQRAAALSQDLRGAPDLDAVTVLGPAPAPITRLNDQWRVHLVCKCPTDTDVEATLARLQPHAAGSSKVRVIIDVDPLTMM